MTGGPKRLAPVAPHSPLEAGKVVGQYTLESLLGEGASGLVWAARDLATGHEVALKFLRAPTPEHTKRLRREGAVLTALRHPRIVAATDLFEDASFGPVLVMERVRGQSLGRLFATRGMLPFEQFAPMADAILDALAAAHALGVIHRDLKPENVMVTESGETFVLDFGMAKLGDAWSERGLTPSITRTGTVMGTPRFMAPEQCFGIRDIDARADLWAFGVIAYRVLSGCFPFAARTYAELMRVFSKGELRAFEPVAPVPAPIRHVIASLLTISRERRPADALFVRAAFREVTT